MYVSFSEYCLNKPLFASICGFIQVVNRHNFAVLFFYSHACGSCRNALPLFEGVVQQLTDADTDTSIKAAGSVISGRDSNTLIFGLVDIFAEKVLTLHFDVKSVPQLIILPYEDAVKV